MKKIVDIETALKMFEEASIIQVESTENGNFKVGNKNYEKVMNAASFLKNQNSIESLFQFLNHQHKGPRLWSACYILHLYEKKAVKVLKEIIKQSGIIGSTAEITLDEWKKGNLTFI